MPPVCMFLFSTKLSVHGLLRCFCDETKKRSELYTHCTETFYGTQIEPGSHFFYESNCGIHSVLLTVKLHVTASTQCSVIVRQLAAAVPSQELELRVAASRISIESRPC